MLQELLDKQKEFFSHFCHSLNLSAAEKMVEKFLLCQGSLVFTGVGKSGLVAKKVAMTMTSTGTKSFFLCPFNALHGDISLLSPKDICVLLSKSGESDELLGLAALLRSRSVNAVAWVSRTNSRLAKACDDSIVLPVQRELCPFDLVPTTSAAVQLLFGDMLAVALLRQRNFSMEQYALNHPGGNIGRKVTLKVCDLMISGDKLPLCSPEQSLVAVLVELSNKQCGCVLIQDSLGRLLGIFTDGDLRRALQSFGAAALEKKMEELMSHSPKTIQPQILAREALQAMESDPKHPVTVLPVVGEQNSILGLIKLHDLIQAGL